MSDKEIVKYRLTTEEATNYMFTNKLFAEKRLDLNKLEKECCLLIKDLTEQHSTFINKFKLKDTDIFGQIQKDKEGFFFTLAEVKEDVK